MGMLTLNHLPTATLLLLLSLLLLISTTFSSSSHAAAASSFGFPIHHRFSDPVKTMLAAAGGEYFPEKGTVDYFAALAERDRVHGRRLAAAGDEYDRPPLTFAAGNYTYRVSSFGFLYYANVSVGTPAKYFLVALDTGSDRFWLPCDCIKCVTAVSLGGGDRVDFSIYSLNTSSTGMKVPCSSPMCEEEGAKTACLLSDHQCPYKVQYLSQNTSSSGYLVEDVLYLATDTNPPNPATSKVTFGCGQRQEGSFLSGGAPNGLLGLGMDKASVPSILSSQNVTAANSFSMCFPAHGSVVGRISFGDTGTSAQSETPFFPRAAHPTYNVSVRQVSVGKTVKDVEESAIMDTGTSFTVLKDPVYSLVTENFDSQVEEEKVENTGFPFEYCYSLSSCDSSSSSGVDLPDVNFTFSSGSVFSALHPVVGIQNGNTCYYCLAVLKNNLVNIIGENFMSGYRIVFNRDKMVLGWEQSDCNYEFETNTLPMGPGTSPSISSNLNPEAIPTRTSGASETGSASTLIIGRSRAAAHMLLSTTAAELIIIVLLFA